MRQAFIFLVAVSIGISSCKDKKKESVDNTVTPTVTNEVANDPAKDSAAIRTVVLDFYNWYNSNYKKLMGYDLYESIKKKNEAPYKIRWDEVEKYQAFVHDSIPQLGAEFLKNQKIMFTKADSAFKVDVKDDVPVYFDYDWYTNSQEDPQYLLDGLNKSTKWSINTKGDDATVEIGAPEDKNYVSGSLLIQLNMKKENGNWKIAKIGND